MAVPISKRTFEWIRSQCAPSLREWRRTLFLSVRTREIKESAHRVRRAATRIPGAVAALERQYLRMHEGLLQLGPAANELVERGQRLVDLASGRHTAQANIERAVNLVDAVLDSLSETQSSLGAMVSEMRRVAGGISSLLRVEKNLSEAISPLDYVQVMLRIESARLRSDEQQVFADLTAEIESLCSRAKRLSAQNIQSIASLESFLWSAITDLEKRHQKRETSLGSKRGEIAAALRQLGDEIRRNGTQKIEITTATAGLADDVNRAVMALQTQDIVAQRMEHARAGLLEAETGVQRYLRTRNASDAVRVKAMLRVEAGQIDSIGDDMLGAEKEINTAVAAIHSYLQTFDADCLALHEFSEITASANGTVQILLDSFLATRDLLTEVAGSVEDVQKLISSCGSLAQNVTSTVQEIAAFMKKIALNAQIQAIKIGDGTGLEVLAAHASGISATTTEIGTRAGEGVAEISARLQSSLDCVNNLRAQCRKQQECLDTEAAAEEKVLHDYRDSALQEVHALSSAIQKARDASADLLASANCSDVLDLLREIKVNAASLENLVGWGIQATNSDLLAVAAGLRSKYSMSREQTAHDRALGNTSSAEPRAPEPESSGVLLAEGVELF